MKESREKTAFPREFKYGDGTADRDVGLSLRDYFAAKAMALALEEYKLVCGIDGGPLADEWHWQQGLSSVAGNAYAFADAMLEARQR